MHQTLTFRALTEHALKQNRYMFKKSWNLKLSLVLLVINLLMADRTLAQSIAPSSPTTPQFATQPTQSSNSTSRELQQIDQESQAPTTPIAQMTSVSRLSDVQPSDWAFQALQSLVERYGCITGYPDSTYRGNRALTRYEFAAGLNTCLDRVNELIAAGSSHLVRKEDLATLQRLQKEFATEMATLRGRVASLETKTAQLEAQQFSPTTKLHAQLITGITDAFGNSVGRNSNRTNAIFGYRLRLNNEASFTGKDLLRVRLEVSDFGSFATTSGTPMTLLNYQLNTNSQVLAPHLLYRTPLGDSVSLTIGPSGVGFTDITDTLTPPTIADDSLGIPSAFGEYNPFYRQGGGGGAINWSIRQNLVLTLGYLAGSPYNPIGGNGLFNGNYNGLAQLAYYLPQGAIGIAYAHSFSPTGTPSTTISQVNLTGGTGSFLAQEPFGNNIATSSDSVALQGFYRFTQHFQLHAWGTYTHATAESRGLSGIFDGIGGNAPVFVNRGSNADIWYWALGITFPDVGGEGNLPGILFGMPPKVTTSSIRRERDSSYHFEAFYRFQLNDYISITPGFWVIFNPENDSRNATQYVGHIRTSFNF